MEPEMKYHEPFIRPLLDAPNSAFRHTTLSGAHPKAYWASYEKIFNDKLLPKRDPLPRDDPRLRKPATDLLVTGSLFRTYKERQTQNHVNSGNLILNQMVQSSQTNSLFHAYGLIRMLLWHHERLEVNILAPALSMRSGFNIPIEMSADLTKVACAPRYRDTSRTKRLPSNRSRPSEFDDPVAERVLKTMKANNISVPERRCSRSHQVAIDRDGLEDQKPLTETAVVPIRPDDLSRHIADLEKAVVELDNATTPSQNGKFRPVKIPYSFRFPDDMVKAFSPTQKTRIGPHMELLFRQIKLEKQFVSSSALTSRLELKERLLETSRVLRGIAARNEVDDFVTAHHLLYERIGIVQDPPLLPLDRRAFEPLNIEVDEFWPQSNLLLLDVQPRKENFASDITSAIEANLVMRELAQTMAQKKTDPLPLALDRLAPNAGRDLVEACPSITNPLKGGRLDPMDVHIRTMTREMFGEIIRAFLEWPFRPTIGQMVSWGGSDDAEGSEKHGGVFNHDD